MIHFFIESRGCTNMRNFLKMTSFKINWGHRGHWGQSKQKFTKSEKLVILIVNLMDNVPEKSVLRKKGDKSGTKIGDKNQIGDKLA